MRAVIGQFQECLSGRVTTAGEDFLEDSALNMNEDALTCRGLFLRITGPKTSPNLGSTRIIVRNTKTRIYLGLTFGQPLSVGDEFQVVMPGDLPGQG